MQLRRFIESKEDKSKEIKIISDILNEIKEYILNNIQIDSKKVFVNRFKNIDVNYIIHNLERKVGKEILFEINVEAFLRKIYQIISLKKLNIVDKIITEFDNYINSLQFRFSDKAEKEDYFDRIEGEHSLLPRKKYEGEKYELQIELMKLQEWVKKNNKKMIIVFEGRDAAGKGSTIKRFIEYMNPRFFNVVALPAPTEEEKNNWFQRYEKHFPKPGEITFFDRSWYNRGVIEPVMGYCTEEQYNDFMSNVLDWEEKLIDSGIILVKLWFSITKEKQLQRFKFRQESPLKYWKFSPNDAKVVDKFEIIGEFKNKMFEETSSQKSPWVVINSNDKKIGRLNAIRYVLSKVDYEGKDGSKCKWYPEVVNILV